MSVPVVESIAVNIAAAINEITIADGYNQNLSAVRPRTNDFQDVMPADGTVLVWQGNAQKVNEAALNTAEWVQQFDLLAIVLDAKGTETSIDTRINQVAADINKKLMADHTRAGNAIDTEISDIVKFDNGVGFTGVAVVVLVTYRTSVTDPYTLV